MAGYQEVHDAERLSQDPTFRLIGSEKIWERGAALTSRLQSFGSNEVRLWLSAIGYNLENLWRGCPLGPALPKRIENCSLTSLQ